MSTAAEVYTFTDKGGHFRLTIKSEFLKKVPNPADFTFAELLQSHEIGKFLHNPHGPAIFVPRNNAEQYWLDGKKVTEEVKEKIQHNVKFNDDLETFLGDAPKSETTT